MSMQSKDDEAVGRLLEGGRYRLERCIGSGGMGAVYLATDTRLGVERAIKLIVPPPADPLALPEQAQSRLDALHGRLVTEAIAAQRLSALSPNVVQVYDVGRCDETGDPFLVMERLEGETLDLRLAYGGPMAVGEALAHGQVLARTLGLGHQLDILHRDLKPSNIMLARRGTEDDVLVVLDFGLAHVEHAGKPRTRSGEVLGTVPYMAPERFHNAPLSPASDVFAIGAILYELLTGTRAVPADDDVAAFRALVERGVAPIRERVPGLPEAVGAVVDRCLHRMPHARPTTGLALASALDGLRRRLSEAELAFIAPTPGADEPSPEAVSEELGDPLGRGGAVVMPLGEVPHAVDAPMAASRPAPAELSAPPTSLAPPSAVEAAPTPGPAAIIEPPPDSSIPAELVEPTLGGPRPVALAPIPAAASLAQPPRERERRPSVLIAAAIVVGGLAIALALFALDGPPRPDAAAAPPPVERMPFPHDKIAKTRTAPVTPDEVSAMLRPAKPSPAAAEPSGAAPPENEPPASIAAPAAEPAPTVAKARPKRRGKTKKTPRGGVIARYAASREGSPSGAKPIERPKRGRRFFKPGGTIPLPEDKPKAPAIPAGTRIEAKLTVGITSSRHVPIVARTTAPVVVNGQTVAPAGALIQGHSSDDGEKVYLDLTHLGPHAIRGHAVTRGQPGLRARKRKTSARDRGSDAFARGALDTVGVVAAGLGAGVAGDLARNVGRETVGEAHLEVRPDRSVVLEVATGAAFTVVVTGGSR